ncbi:uncharacterized protein VP01_1162g3, partial [Puccinia sorghi]
PGILPWCFFLKIKYPLDIPHQTLFIRPELPTGVPSISSVQAESGREGIFEIPTAWKTLTDCTRATGSIKLSQSGVHQNMLWISATSSKTKSNVPQLDFGKEGGCLGQRKTGKMYHPNPQDNYRAAMVSTTETIRMAYFFADNKEIAEEWNSFRGTIDIHLVWCPGNQGIVGKKAADTLASETNERNTSPDRRLKGNVNKVSMNIKQQILKIKRTELKNQISDLPINVNSLISQLLLGHSPLDQHLFKAGKLRSTSYTFAHSTRHPDNKPKNKRSTKINWSQWTTFDPRQLKFLFLLSSHSLKTLMNKINHNNFSNS